MLMADAAARDELMEAEYRAEQRMVSEKLLIAPAPASRAWRLKRALVCVLRSGKQWTRSGKLRSKRGTLCRPWLPTRMGALLAARRLGCCDLDVTGTACTYAPPQLRGNAGSAQ